jgi:FkbM family methyltransferase
MKNRENIKLNVFGHEAFYLIPEQESSNLANLEKDFNKMASILWKFLRQKDITYIDIGARDGDSILYLKPFLKNIKKIIAFEPNKEETHFLRQNLSMNNIDCELHEFAIAEMSKDYDFYWDEKGRNGGVKTKESSIGNWDETKSFPAYCYNDLDPDLKEKLSNADFIKVDTEGYDIKVLNELLPCIQKSLPFIMIEWWPHVENQIVEFCNKNSYYPYDPYHNFVRQELVLSQRVDNLILIHSSKLQSLS